MEFLLWNQTLQNILMHFFQQGIWVVGFFFLLTKTFEDEKIMHVSKYIMAIVLVLLFIGAIVNSI